MTRSWSTHLKRWGHCVRQNAGNPHSGECSNLTACGLRTGKPGQLVSRGPDSSTCPIYADLGARFLTPHHKMDTVRGGWMPELTEVMQTVALC